MIWQILLLMVCVFCLIQKFTSSYILYTYRNRIARVNNIEQNKFMNFIYSCACHACALNQTASEFTDQGTERHVATPEIVVAAPTSLEQVPIIQTPENTNTDTSRNHRPDNLPIRNTDTNTSNPKLPTKLPENLEVDILANRWDATRQNPVAESCNKRLTTEIGPNFPTTLRKSKSKRRTQSRNVTFKNEVAKLRNKEELDKCSTIPEESSKLGDSSNSVNLDDSMFEFNRAYYLIEMSEEEQRVEEQIEEEQRGEEQRE